MNVDVLYVNRSGESLKSIVVEAVERCHQAQVFGHALRQSLRERVVLHGQRYVVAQQVQRLQFLLVVNGLAISTSEGDCSYQLSAYSQWSHTAK